MTNFENMDSYKRGTFMVSKPTKKLEKETRDKLFYPSERVITTLTTCFSSLCPFLLSADMIKLLLLKLSQFTVCNEIVNIPVVMIDF